MEVSAERRPGGGAEGYRAKDSSAASVAKR